MNTSKRTNRTRMFSLASLGAMMLVGRPAFADLPPPPPPESEADLAEQPEEPATASKQPLKGSGSLDGGYVLLSLPTIASNLPVAQGTPYRTTRWAVHGGYALSSGHSRVALGLGLEHAFSSETHNVRTLVETRLGGGNQRVFGYARIGVGYAHIWGWNAFAFDIGPGVLGRIGKHFLIGAEGSVLGGSAGRAGADLTFHASVVLGATF